VSGQNIFPRAPSQPDTRTRRALRRLADIDIATSQPVVVLLDNFVSGAVTSLALHPPDVGPAAWAQQQSSGTVAQVQNGTDAVLFDQNGHGGNMVWTLATQTQPGGTFYVGVKVPAGKQGVGGLAFRVTNGGDDLTAVLVDSINNLFKIVERNASVYTTRAQRSLTIASDSNYSVVAVLSGTTLSATLTGPNAPTSPLSYNGLSTNLTGTTHGLLFGGNTIADSLYALGPYKMTVP
jgi:hypothetical protein